jgi:hypothetical protein
MRVTLTSTAEDRGRYSIAKGSVSAQPMPMVELRMSDQSFSIAFVRKTQGAETEFGDIIGHLHVGSRTREGFFSHTGYWAEEDYERSWVANLRAIADHPRSSAALLTDVAGPGRTGHLLLYALYREDDRVYVRENLFIASWLPGDFDPAEPGRLIESRADHADDSQPMEWTTSIQAITEYLGRDELVDPCVRRGASDVGGPEQGLSC